MIFKTRDVQALLDMLYVQFGVYYEAVKVTEVGGWLEVKVNEVEGPHA